MSKSEFVRGGCGNGGKESQSPDERGDKLEWSTEKAWDKRVRTIYSLGIGVTTLSNMAACCNGAH